MTEPPKIIDWLTVTKGHPLGDVGRTTLMLTMGDLPPDTPFIERIIIKLLRSIFNKTYLKHYFERSEYKREDLKKWMLPVIAERISEGIEKERDELFAILRAEL